MCPDTTVTHVPGSDQDLQKTGVVPLTRLAAVKRSSSDMEDAMNAALERAEASAKFANDLPLRAALVDLSYVLNAHYRSRCRDIRDTLLALGLAH